MSNQTVNPQSQALEKRLDALRKSQAKSDLKVVMALPDGRRLMYRIIYEICHVEALSYTGNSDTTLREGERNAGLTIKNELMDEHPDAYLDMILEMLTARKDEILKRKAMRELPAED